MDLLPLYLRHIDAAILCYDITNRTSFEHLDKWFDLPCIPKDIVQVIVGCKADLTRNKKVTSVMLQEKLEERGVLQGYEASAKTGQNIVDIFQYLHSALEPNADCTSYHVRTDVVIIPAPHEEDKSRKEHVKNCCIASSS